MTEYPRLACRMIGGKWTPVSEHPTKHTRQGNGSDDFNTDQDDE